MKIKTGYYTQQEDDTIYKLVGENPHRLVSAFEIAAEKLNRNRKSIKNRWYGVLKNKNRHVSVLGSSGSFTPMNQKNIHKTKSKSLSKADLVSIIDKLSVHELKFVIPMVVNKLE